MFQQSLPCWPLLATFAQLGCFFHCTCPGSLFHCSKLSPHLVVCNLSQHAANVFGKKREGVQTEEVRLVGGVEGGGGGGTAKTLGQTSAGALPPKSPSQFLVVSSAQRLPSLLTQVVCNLSQHAANVFGKKRKGVQTEEEVCNLSKQAANVFGKKREGVQTEEEVCNLSKQAANVFGKKREGVQTEEDPTLALTLGHDVVNIKTNLHLHGSVPHAVARQYYNIHIMSSQIG
ncbi:hypothetical protein VOLCADRAFT_96734 [Volvox carteri f. nagariensis]|uniref:Uncharacterized protein n=1 Tax=Volvox carteri f. nagariensis TaxID=3068 RepID=D8UAW9_VOLCA|nr:uncharacterized protein VOLCADRAFT_96734 [Volvox carteri f. nagariensis]EFJ43230.1 hypothetical protein VOLCADRAFT_96734 [Volvox carteri f. nagariensis]|eukprot:XP_002955805.1 hypothetical protein VOLCADRAFT_96734 [Volvox carteri f. nagariensis]